jgi:hypothetical protein
MQRAVGWLSTQMLADGAVQKAQVTGAHRTSAHVALIESACHKNPDRLALIERPGSSGRGWRERLLERTPAVTTVTQRADDQDCRIGNEHAADQSSCPARPVRCRGVHARIVLISRGPATFISRGPATGRRSCSSRSMPAAGLRHVRCTHLDEHERRRQRVRLGARIDAWEEFYGASGRVPSGWRS